MANFTPIKAGGWVFREKVTSTQMTTIQEYLLKCPNFSDGSIHNPTNPIVVGGAGITGRIDQVPRGVVVSANNQTVSLQDYDIIWMAASSTIVRLNLANYGEDWRSLWIVCNTTGGSVVYDHADHPLHNMELNTWCRLARRSAGVYGWVNLGQGVVNPVTTV
jgi:hypothetical protein